jgi:hypothetical protein
MLMRSVLTLVLLALGACGGGGGGGSSPDPSPGPANPNPGSTASPSSITFSDDTAASGLSRQWGYLESPISDAEFMAGGLAAADYDGDGDIDVYVVGGDLEANRLFSNQGDGSFIDVAPDVGLDLVHRGSGPAFADIDSDGDLDLFVGGVENSAVRLLENRDGNYVEITAESGLQMAAPNTFSASFGDDDGDGDLDLVVGHWGNTEQPDTETLWRNNGDGTFINRSRPSGIAATLIDSAEPEALQIRAPSVRLDNSFTPVFSDLDNDGDQDLLIASDFRTSQVYRNNGDATYTLRTDRLVIRDQAGMGSAVGDYDNDGDMDWFVTSIYRLEENTDDLLGYGNRLYRNDGQGVFEDVTDEAGVADGGWGWGACFADLDNDGHLDIVHVNGWNQLDDRAENDYTRDQIRLFHSNGDGSFSEQAEDAGLVDRGQGRGIACFDADRDGLLDILVANSDSNHLVFYRNTSDTENHYVTVKLESNGDNHFGIGARVSATTVDGTQVREIRIGNNFTSHNPAEAHFGLGEADQVDIEVRWPDGSVSTQAGLAADQLVTVSRQVVTGLRLNVDGGSGSGRFDAGEQIAVVAAAPAENYYFSHWSSDGGGIFENATDQSTTFTMPDATVRITANYLPGVSPAEGVSLARQWNEVLLQSIRNDLARPTVHARNLFHISAAVYDAWSAYDETAVPWLLGRARAGEACSFDGLSGPADVTAARREALSYAVYRLIRHRFEASPGVAQIRRDADALMSAMGYDPAIDTVDYIGGPAAALGNHIADCYIRFGLADGANESMGYANVSYSPVNPPLAPHEPGNPDIVDLNRWQPLKLEVSIDQAGNAISNQPAFLGPEWGIVVPFSLSAADLTIYQRDGFDYWVYHDPGSPPTFDGALAEQYKWSHSLVAKWSAHLDPTDGMMVDISPNSLGNIQNYPSRFEDHPDFYDELAGGDPSTGYEFNPVTGLAYEPQIVPRGDYARVLAEFWADGPDSETPPGHWFVIINEVNGHPLLTRQFEGVGPELPMLEWDVKAYFMLGGAMHDTAITAWGIKGWYDYIRPISSLRALAALGQSSDDTLESYHVDGIPLEPGYIELVSDDDSLAGDSGEHVGKIKVRAWKGPDYIIDPAVDVAGVDWILAENWWPYQRPSFVTPPFAGYVSGHSTYSRAAAEVLTRLTGSEYFPGGMSGFEVRANEFLVFEEGPSVDMTLEWAKYYDASDQCSLSRIWGGIHPPIDDIPGRVIGMQIGPDAFDRAKTYFDGTATD